MTKALNRLNRGLQITAMIIGALAFAIIALIVGAAFKPKTQYALLHDVLDPVGDTHYTLTWSPPSEAMIGQFGPDEQNTYGKVLSSFLSGKLQRVEPARAEVTSDQTINASDGTKPLKAIIRLQSRVTPNLILKNKSFAAFDVQTDTLVLELHPKDGTFTHSRLETRFETVRIASTNLGLSVRHIETTRSPERLSFATQVTTHQRLAGFNYYPASAPWDLFWREFPVSEIRTDFRRIRATGSNSVRVFLNRTAFAAEESRVVSLKRLVQLLDIAEENDLRVIVTCFDFGRGYNLKGLAEDWTHLDRILDVIADHAALDLIDLKNEPDLDFERWGLDRVEAWLSTLATLTKTKYPDLPLTIGWSNAKDATRLTGFVDVVSFHDYELASGLSMRIKDLKAAASGKAVMLTEIGHTKWGINPFRKSPANAFAAQFDQAGDLDGVFVWTLNDFDHVPGSVAGWQPWRKAMQAKFGLDDDSLTLASTFFRSFVIQTDQQPQPTHSN